MNVSLLHDSKPCLCWLNIDITWPVIVQSLFANTQ